MGAEEFFEYETFSLDLDGKEMEFAITEEFDLEDSHYILCAEVVGDEVNDEDLYLFAANMDGDEIEVMSIENQDEYNHVVEEYYKLFGDIEEE